MIDVLIVGAGPTGLLMAAEAARYKMKCRIVDKLAVPEKQSRALAIQPRTLELFNHLGIAEEFLAKGLKIIAANPISGKKRLARISFETLPSDYPFILSLEQSETERILTKYLSTFGILVERETELISLAQDSDRISASLLDLKSGKENRIEAKWAVGCDGAHSQVRKSIGVPFSGKPFPSLFSLADVQLDWNFPRDELFLFLDSAGLLGAIPMPGERRYRLVFQSKKRLEIENEELLQTREGPTLREVQELVRKRVGDEVKVSNPVWLADFHINSRLVENYRKGRIFLAGDAAHIHSPAGGQGMNSGLQDVFNLAWKLADGREKLLDTYNLERRSWGKSLVRTTRRITNIATLHNSAAVFLRNWAIRHFAAKIERRLACAVAQIAIRYPKSLIACEKGFFTDGPKAGTRAPDAPAASAGKRSLYSLFRQTTGFHLLLFGDFPSFEYSGLAIHRIDDERAKSIYGVKDKAAYLIRPDQTIALRCLDLEPVEKHLTMLNKI